MVAIISMEQGDGACDQMEDWAIFVLEDAVGDEVGFLGARGIDCEGEKHRAVFVSWLITFLCLCFVSVCVGGEIDTNLW